MDEKTPEIDSKAKEERFDELLMQEPYNVDEMVELLNGMNSAAADTRGVSLLVAMSKNGNDFDGLMKLALAAGRCSKGAWGSKFDGRAVREALRACAGDDRIRLSLIDGVGFGTRPFRESIFRLDRLLAFTPGTLVLSEAWGLGEIMGIDDFYCRVTVSFRTDKNHQFSYDTACETLRLAPEDHILVKYHRDPNAVKEMLKEKPGEFVIEMLRGFGDMTVGRLEEYCEKYSFVQQADWKKFWDRARSQLRTCKNVDLPSRRTDPIRLGGASSEVGSDAWFAAFTSNRDPASILDCVLLLDYDKLDAEKRVSVAERLAFALKGVRLNNDSLYARIAFCIDNLKLDYSDEAFAFARPEAARAYLWTKNPVGDEERFMRASRELPVREIGRLVKFLVGAEKDAELTPEQNERKVKLLAMLPKMSYTFASEVIAFFLKDADCEEAVCALVRNANAPATLVTLMFDHYKLFASWGKRPPLVLVLSQAIAIGEGRQSGEALRMQNIVRRRFADQKWLEGVFTALKDRPTDRILFFERFQASVAWDPSTHHMIVVRMTKLDPELAALQVKKVVAKEVERITSMRSYAERQAAYEKLINVEIPENTRRIEFARGYGDLSENAEYQYAKDEQRALLKKQTDMQDELNVVKAVDFSDVVNPTEVCSGSTVTVITAAGDVRTFTVLGEWDNALELGIISSKTRLAQNMLGKKVGDVFDLPDAEGKVSTATVQSVAALSDALRAWVKEVPAAN